MARYEDDDDEDDRPRKSRKQTSSNNNTVLILVLVGGFGAAFFCCIPIMIALLLPAVQQAREAARITQSKNNLKQIGLGMHNFHDVHQHFPPQDLKPDEQPQSWMVELLPYLDQAPLYNTINRQAPWDDPNNMIAMSARVPAFLNPSIETQIDPLTGQGLGHYAGNSYIFNLEKPMSIRDMKDGTSNTMLAGSVASSFRPWGDPGNVRDPANGVGPGPTQYLHSPRGRQIAIILMGDGSVRTISPDIAAGVMDALAKPDDGVAPPPF